MIAMSDIMKKGIVFPQFISAKRMLMMSSILKQCSVLGLNGIYDEEQLLESSDIQHIPKLHGRNVLCAVMDWNGYTHEDSAVISESLAEKLTTYKNLTEIVEHKNTLNLFIKVNDLIRPNSIIATTIENNEIKYYRSSNNINAIVNNIEFETDFINGEYINRFKIKLIAEYKCNIGSKISNLHSVKNIISAILPDKRMPIMQDGTSIELIVSPSSISNRKNPSMIMECMLGMYLRELGYLHNIQSPTMIVEKFDKDITFYKAAELLETVDLPENCMFRLKNGTKGHVFKYSTLVGYIFLMRLHHHSEDKVKYSNEIQLDHRGYAQLGIGSQRLNRDEMEIIYNYGANNIINEAKKLNNNTSIINTIKEYVKCIGYQYV